MTFRIRVIAATVAAAAIAVILACFASYFTTRNALYHSVDASLMEASQQPLSNHDYDRVIGASFELVLPNRETMPASRVPLDATIMSVADGKSTQVIRTVSFNGQDFRELIVPVAANTIAGCSAPGDCQAITSTSAELYVVEITGQVDQLNQLTTTLMLVAAGGLLLAFALGLFLARQALHPLEEVTDEIETIATTNDLERRLVEGDEDELGRLRRVFNRLLHSVQSSQKLQQQLVLDASHELRTPLTSLRTNAQVLSRIDELSHDELRQISGDMISQVDELAALVTDLGELARGERSEGALEVLRLDDCVDECVDTARTYARTKHITIEVEEEPSRVNARHDRLTRAISNLLTNAIKFTPDGGQIMVKTANGVVSVSDSGPGVAAEDYEHIFDRFWRSAAARSMPGSGLGLSIVAQVAAEFDGTVSVDRDPNLGGARFTLHFPVIAE
ncbi:MAG TPA: HAMP domain-containing sensor histidine kinase [Acidimicrobiales bacterium]|nr:HAMP domain-containing sensor histidine kinase [Acidimicrobiales bacterium]